MAPTKPQKFFAVDEADSGSTIPHDTLDEAKERIEEWLDDGSKENDLSIEVYTQSARYLVTKKTSFKKQ